MDSALSQPQQQQQPRVPPNGTAALPEGWDIGRDFDGKVYFIDHNSKRTTWVDPREEGQQHHGASSKRRGSNGSQR